MRCTTKDCTGKAKIRGGLCDRCKDEQYPYSPKKKRKLTWDADGDWIRRRLKEIGRDTARKDKELVRDAKEAFDLI